MSNIINLWWAVGLISVFVGVIVIIGSVGGHAAKKADPLQYYWQLLKNKTREPVKPQPTIDQP